MIFRKKAEFLSKILHQLVVSLQTYDADDRSKYPRQLAKSLKPYLDQYDEVVFVKSSIELAADILSDAKELMHKVSAANSKGEINFDQDNLISQYWELETIFRDEQYKQDTL